MSEFEIRPSFAWRFGQSALFLSALVVMVVMMVSAGPSFAIFWIAGIALVANAWCWIRLWQVKLILENDKVAVVDMFKTVEIPRSNVERITPSATAGTFRYEYFIDFRDGGHRRVSWLFSFFKPNYDKQVKLNQINSWASDAKQTAR